MNAKADLFQETFFTPEEPDITNIITEDDTPVDNIFSEKQQRLLTESLNTSWKPGRQFVTACNVGIFYAINQAPVVPDMFLSLDVCVPENLWEKRHRSYFIWEFGKPPEVVVEIVSNKQGGETNGKFLKYAQIGVWYYIIFDPLQLIQNNILRIYELSPGNYIPKLDRYLSHVELSLNIWEGIYEGKQDKWLRWYDKNGELVKTGFEQKQRAEQAEKQLMLEKQWTEKIEKELIFEKQHAEQEKQRADLLAEKLKALGIAP